MPTIVQKKKCFLISPIGSDESEIRDRADMFREDIVRAAIGDQYEVKRADDYNRAGNITSQVIEAIVEADLIVADLTGRNANVYYELSVAHCYRRHVVPMRDMADTEDLPFDNYTERTLPYSLIKLRLRDRARELLSKAVEETVGQTPSNPVTTALGLKRAEQGGDNVATILTSLSAQVSMLERKLSEQDREGRSRSLIEKMAAVGIYPTDVRGIVNGAIFGTTPLTLRSGSGPASDASGPPTDLDGKKGPVS